MDEIALQRQYYDRTASMYDSMHLNEGDHHYLSLELLAIYIRRVGAKSILDIGSGTGRGIVFLKERFPDLRIIGIEPAASLREIGYRKKIDSRELVDGDATSLCYADEEFDIVCEFGALHHIKHVDLAVREMCRVSRLGVFISDANNFGQGSPIARVVKQILHFFRLWPVANYVKTRGKGYMYTEGDGVAFSYSVFDSLDIVRSKYSKLYFTNTEPCDGNMYRSAAHLNVFAVK